MQKSYSKNYFKIYVFQILSILLGFVSLFIVVPYLSTDINTFGIYTVCVSVTIFLSYADLGFLGAGMKYAAECYSNNDRDGEMKIIGFSHFMLFAFLGIFSIFFIYLSFNPQLLINGIKSGRETQIAHSLFLILALFSPTIILQRVLQMIFSIRLQDFILQKYSNKAKLS
jgi:O-antigen/teichoic acid export membrane protein